jgi:pimeloyl-[acyl-carrier protein] methyl ester esterase
MQKSRLVSETFGNPDNPPLVFLHGWGNHSGVWQPLIQALQKRYCINAIDLPGYGRSPASGESWQASNLVESLINTAPKQAIWCGWSLGGALASAVADRLCIHGQPAAITGLITLCANPRFVRAQGWSEAMSKSLFKVFSRGLKAFPEQTLKRFQGLMVKGGINARDDLQALKLISRQAEMASAETLVASLKLLEMLDNRAALTHLSIPQLHVFGENDALVPASVGDQVQVLNSKAQVVLLKGAAHVPQLSHVDELVTLIDGFIQTQVLKESAIATTSDG